ncbi:D-aminoacylase [Ferruginibacter paludis]|uniref:N-acyl-D-amino-acid deacylase family protein n=1 Tax=Ferruginibacter paludis TaxID=1310417 RepID=UPI0025B45B13|nr:D-aminoacylase [Ferruginibacter paludis]MDN3655965.1 D-aminoacylase [Ferruginibacter paludis]
MKKYLLLLVIPALHACTNTTKYDTIIRNAMIYDGNGGAPYKGDIAVNADTIAAMGDLSKSKASEESDAKGMAVAPGFSNMMGHSEESLFQDSRALSDVKQGVTMEVFGESSFAPLNATMKRQAQEGQGDVKYTVSWNTLGEYMNTLEKRGIAVNISSFVGTGTVRQNIIGEGNVAPTAQQLDSMKRLVRQAMEEGALGVTNALIYPPDFFAKTDELIALSKEAAKYGGTYSSHMRSEGNRLVEAVNEIITIGKEANIPVHIYHLKAAGKNNWNKMDSVIKMVNDARANGLQISADMYTYLAGATGLTSSFPPTLQDGGFGKLWERLHDVAIRKQMAAAMNTNAAGWENLYYGCGGADHVLLLSFKQDSLKKYTGKTLAEVAKLQGKSPEATAMDLIISDSTRVGVAYFLMTEDNVKKQVALPWVSFGSDEGSYAPEGVFLKSQPHPRAYGNFARVLGHYSRDEKELTLQQAIYQLAKLPIETLKIKKRGELKVGNYADIIIFDPAKVNDLATYDKPQQFATGMIDVLVNGKLILKDGDPTNATPGQFVKGPGYNKK